jgi:hypothetical protein
MLPFENAKLLPKSKVFEEQVAARAKEASGHDRQKPQQAHHETSFARVHAKAGTQLTYLIRQQIAILASHSSAPFHLSRKNVKGNFLSHSEFATIEIFNAQQAKRLHQ